MNKYKPYPEYKDSGVEWLGKIPSGWKISKLRYWFDFGKGLSITKENLKDTGVPCVNYGEVHSKYGFEVDPAVHPLKYVDKKYLKSSPNSLLSKGDFIFADTSEDIEGSGNFTQLISDKLVFAGYHTVIVRPKDGNDHRYLAYALDSSEYRIQIQNAVKGVKVFSITQAILRNSNIWFTSLPEQQKIAAFLDDETGKIDELIEKQKILIALLEEKRQAVISHAVTKGLNPNTPMKDSGVEWLGKIPEHWAVKKIKHLSPVKRGASPRPIDDQRYFDVNGEYAWVRISDVTASGEYLTRTTQRLSALGSSLSVKIEPNEIFLSIAGTVGKPCIAGMKSCIHDGFVYFPSLNIPVEFLYYVFAAGEAYKGLGKFGTQLNLNTDTVGDIKIGCPTCKKQEEIAEYLDNETKKFEKLITKAKSAIELMKERRTALISAAVTGKINVSKKMR